MNEGVDLIRRAEEQERDERLHRQWSVQLPFMGTETYVSFAEYKAQVTGANIDTRPTGEVVEECWEIERQLTRQKGDPPYGV